MGQKDYTEAPFATVLPCSVAGARGKGEKPLSRNTAQRSVPGRLLNVHEVAEYTGLSPHTLYTMVSQRRIPFVKVGRLLKFDLGLLDSWIRQHTVMPMTIKNT